ncbi:MAG: ribonuclease P protein component [Verrucomicrobiia bacterium]|jgi:ribonuclease P protein component
MNPGASARLRLTRAMRIRQGGDFARLKQHGQRLAQGGLVLNWLELPEGAPSQSQARFAVITTRKLGNAVIRNRARRLLRECFRLHQHALRVPVEMVLIARRSLVGQSFAGVEADYLAILRSAKLISN